MHFLYCILISQFISCQIIIVLANGELKFNRRMNNFFCWWKSGCLRRSKTIMNCCKYSHAWINRSVKHHLSNLSRQASLWNDFYQEMIAFGVLNVELCSLGSVIVTPLVLQSCASALIFIAFQIAEALAILNILSFSCYLERPFKCLLLFFW